MLNTLLWLIFLSFNLQVASFRKIVIKLRKHAVCWNSSEMLWNVEGGRCVRYNQHWIRINSSLYFLNEEETPLGDIFFQYGALNFTCTIRVWWNLFWKTRWNLFWTKPFLGDILVAWMTMLPKRYPNGTMLVPIGIPLVLKSFGRKKQNT